MRALVPLCCLFATAATIRAEEPPEAPSPPYVVSGFEPFGGRTVNGSFVLAKAIAAAHPGFKAVEVPVTWGAPMEAWRKHGQKARFWLAFGEGTGGFQIEIHARNERGAFPDNNRSTPSEPHIVKDSPEVLDSPLPAEAMAGALRAQGFPVRVSRNAGQYLCEEMLYTLLASRKDAATTVMFVHVPVLGRKTRLPDGTEREVTPEWMASFGTALVAELSRQKLLPVEK